MCRSKMATRVVKPTPRPSRAAARPSQRTPSPSRRATAKPSTSGSSSSDPSTSNATTSSGYGNSRQTSSVVTSSSLDSLTRVRETLPGNPLNYDFSELRAATNQFLAKRYSSSTACWRCELRGKDAIVFQRKLRRPIEAAPLRERLAEIGRSNHISLIKLLGVSISGGHIYMAYDFVIGANLADCLRNPRNPNFTVLSTWISRMQIATDLAHGLDYIHHNTGLNANPVHNHIKSSSVIVTEPSFNARICHFGTADLCGEATADRCEPSPPDSKSGGGRGGGGEISEITEEVAPRSSEPENLNRSNSGMMQFEGVRGYMPPEFRSTGVGTQKSDVYAFGVVILELLSGEEPLKFRFDRERGDFMRTSVIETARAAMDGGGGDGWSREGRMRRWVDGRLKDSFPVEVAEKLTRVALECVHVDPDKRPSMRRVAGKISKLYLESRIWSDSLSLPNGISVSLAPR